MSVLKIFVGLACTVGLIVAFVLLALLGDSVGGPQNTFAPAGEVASKQKDLFLIALWPAIAILILVFAAIGYIFLRFHQRREDEPPPPQVHGNQRLELAWTIAPTLLLFGLAVPMISTLVDLGEAASEDALVVDVTAQRFSWLFEYPDLVDSEGNTFAPVPSELHVPVDREIVVNLHALDVIHSFWVQRLAGKRDAVPGRTNRLVFKADEPGEYPGQCAEFCGIQHAEMKFTVIAHTPEEFQAWCEEQLGEPGAEACQPVTTSEE